MSSRRAFSGSLLGLRVDTVVARSGEMRRREVVEHPGAVAVVPLLEDGRVLLVRQFRLPARQQLLEIPAGTLKRGESPSACARRELAEEVGYRPGRLIPLGKFYSSPGYCEELIHAFLATDLKPAPTEPDPDERIEVKAVHFWKLAEMAAKGRLRDGTTIAAVLMAAPRVAALHAQQKGRVNQAKQAKADSE